MREIIVLSCLGLVLVLVFLMTRIRYRVGSRNFEVILFGIRMRRIPLTDIRGVSKHRPGWCEKWPNTLFPAKRLLFIHRRSGRFKHILITPTHRYAFKAEILRGVQRARALEAAARAEPSPKAIQPDQD
jgi:hypothetical protein